MKLIYNIVTFLGSITIICVGAGALVALMPLAAVFPKHGETLIRIQAGGLCVFGVSLVILFLLALVASATEKYQYPKIDYPVYRGDWSFRKETDHE